MKFNRIVFEEAINNIPVSNLYCERLIITGTFLLSAYGLLDEFEDIDILVIRASKEFWSEMYNDNNDYEIKEYDGYESIKIKKNGYTYNLIVDDSYKEETFGYVDLNGEYELDTLSHALKAKAKLNREKDFTHFKNIKENINNWMKIKTNKIDNYE